MCRITVTVFYFVFLQLSSAAFAIGSGSFDVLPTGREVGLDLPQQGESSRSAQGGSPNRSAFVSNELYIPRSNSATWGDVADYISSFSLQQANIHNITQGEYLQEITLLRFSHPPEGMPTPSQLDFLSSFPHLRQIFFGNNRGVELGFLFPLQQTLGSRFVAIEFEYPLLQDALERQALLSNPSFSMPPNKASLHNRYFILVNEDKLSGQERKKIYGDLFPTSFGDLPYELKEKILGFLPDLGLVSAVDKTFNASLKPFKVKEFKRILFVLHQADRSVLIKGMKSESSVYVENLVLVGLQSEVNEFLQENKKLLKEYFPKIKRVTIVHPSYLNLAKTSLFTPKFPSKDEIVRVKLNNGKHVFLSRSTLQFIKDPYENTILQFPREEDFLDDFLLVKIGRGNGNYIFQYLRKDRRFLTSPGKQESLQFREAHPFSNGLALVSVKVDNFTVNRFLKSDGTFLSSPGGRHLEFRKAHSFSNGFALVEIHNFFRFLKPDGTYLSSPEGELLEFSDARDFSDGFAIVKVLIEGEHYYRFLKPDGSFLKAPGRDEPLQFMHAHNFSNGLATVQVNNLEQYLTREGRLLATFPAEENPHSQFVKAGPLKNGLFRVRVE
ncbi:MAG: hypothetical protein K2X39_04280, partial [Silvanigrellaceae bacterium]|nr:hypothetical protein [Silvanigrellaceae bacterium]